jgi:membrane protease YdiL (CAAX protease family)
MLGRHAPIGGLMDGVMAAGVARVRGEGPARLLFLALCWVVLAIGMGFLAGAALGFVVGLHNAHAPQGPHWEVGPLTLLLAAVLPLQLTLLLAARRRGRIVGGGDRSAGLGLGPIRRPRLLAAFAVAQILCVGAWAVLLATWLGHAPATANSRLLHEGAAAGGSILLGAIFVAEVLLAPLCEELFFRGWLWTGLRRHWPALPVALVTALPWIALHALDGGLTRILFLLPAALFLSLARHYCNSLKASLTLHILNNLAATALVALALAGR